MTLSTRQAAERLGISQARVKSLIRRGILTDLMAHIPGRHQFLIDSRQVTEIKAQGRVPPNPRGGGIIAQGFVPAVSGGSGAAEPGTSLTAMLQAIDAKLDTVLSRLT